jgi:hypothetical protein
LVEWWARIETVSTPCSTHWCTVLDSRLATQFTELISELLCEGNRSKDHLSLSLGQCIRNATVIKPKATKLLLDLMEHNRFIVGLPCHKRRQCIKQPVPAIPTLDPVLCEWRLVQVVALGCVERRVQVWILVVQLLFEFVSHINP